MLLQSACHSSFMYTMNHHVSALCRNEFKKINLVDNQETGFEEEGPDSMEGLLKARKWVLWLAVIVTLLYVVLWPCLACAAECGALQRQFAFASADLIADSLSVLRRIFSEGMFTLYVVISFIYGFLASGVVLAALLSRLKVLQAAT